LKALQEFKI